MNPTATAADATVNTAPLASTTVRAETPPSGLFPPPGAAAPPPAPEPAPAPPAPPPPAGFGVSASSCSETLFTLPA
ncbi:MAG: hypothetical protein KC776_18180, partial [Myxococcales bacterium]|nr:hypothetical protein [Myxococcales bacterium]